MLLLFDIDGTLVRDRPLTHQEALTDAAVQVFGLRVAPGESPIRDVEPWGKTDRQILRDVLAAAALAAPSTEDVARWELAACEAYERLEVDDAAPRHAETATALERLRDSGHSLALVTGNLEPIARLKLDRAGLGSFFPAGQGGFGSDREDRGALPDLARERAGGRPRAAAAVIGDTPLDIACARADGVRCIAITTGPYTAAELREADAIVDHLGEVGGALARLNGSSPVRADHGIA
jgi:phosphoglycolate phosphatase-like HAD superfamily hydrolase